MVIPLATARRVQYRLRMRVSGMLTLVGWVLMVAAFVPSLTKINGFWITGALGHPYYYLALMPWGTTLLVLAVRPVDENIILALRVVVMVCCTTGSVSYFSSASYGISSRFSGTWAYPWTSPYIIAGNSANAILLLSLIHI